MRKIVKAFSAVTTAIILAIGVLGLSAMPIKAEDINSVSFDDISRFNIMLVIDGSGSLVSRSGATDPEGIRYDAIDLFLALLPNDSNLVGAIVFDDNTQDYLLKTDPKELDGKNTKIELSKAIREAGTGGDTDIGTALLEAVSILEGYAEENTESVVILFSDGRTDLGGNNEAYEQSLNNKEAAIIRAQEVGIPILTICLHANDVADPAELREIAERTSGQAVEVFTSQDLGNAFEQFYNLIFHTSAQERVDAVFPDSGILEYDVPVPAYGAKEVNVITNGEAVGEINLDSPTGLLSASEIDAMQMTGGSYRIVKLSDPAAGNWKVRLMGTPGSTATVNVVYNIDTSARLFTVDGNEDYKEGEPVELVASLFRDGRLLTDPAIASEYQAQVRITDLQTGRIDTYPMQPRGSGSFSYVVENGGYTSYEANATLSCDSLTLQTESVCFNFGNTAPYISPDLDSKDLQIRAIVTPLTGRRRTVDLSKLFKDDQDEVLTYTIQSSQLVKDSFVLEDSVLTVQTAKSKSGDLCVRATDSQGAYEELTLRVRATNITLPIILLIILGALAAVLIPLLIAYLNRPTFKGIISVTNISTGITGHSQADFRGSIPLAKLVIGPCGFSVKKSRIVAQRFNGVRFITPKNQPFYVDEQRMNSVELMIGKTFIYADENKQTGIEIEVSTHDMMY